MEKKQGKAFFFEKKKQKTFVNYGLAVQGNGFRVIRGNGRMDAGWPDGEVKEKFVRFFAVALMAGFNRDGSRRKAGDELHFLVAGAEQSLERVVQH